MADVIVVRLSPHRIGFYDPLTGLHLAKGIKEEGAVAPSSDLRNIRAAVRSGGLILVHGSLEESENKRPEPAAEAAVQEEKPAEQPVEKEASEETEAKAEEAADQTEEQAAEAAAADADEQSEQAQTKEKKTRKKTK